MSKHIYHDRIGGHQESSKIIKENFYFQLKIPRKFEPKISRQEILKSYRKISKITTGEARA